jgi:hypothetical protein
MSDTTSFVDPVFLARFGLQRANVIDYFLHPLNPFRTSANTSNEVLGMQGITIGLLMQQGFFQQDVRTPKGAEDEYQKALRRLTGEQYELLPPTDPSLYTQPSALYTIRHVLRTTPSSPKILGVYYIVEGVIYKSPAVRSLMKANVARTLGCLAGATDSLSKCARYQPSLGYLWVFDEKEEEMSPYELIQMSKKRKRRKILDHRRPGERTAAEEEGIRATEALDQILVRLSKSKWVTGKGDSKPTATERKKAAPAPSK